MRARIGRNGSSRFLSDFDGFFEKFTTNYRESMVLRSRSVLVRAPLYFGFISLPCPSPLFSLFVTSCTCRFCLALLHTGKMCLLMIAVNPRSVDVVELNIVFQKVNQRFGTIMPYIDQPLFVLFSKVAKVGANRRSYTKALKRLNSP